VHLVGFTIEKKLTIGSMVWGLNPSGGMSVSPLYTWSDQSWGPPNLLYNAYRGSFLGGRPPTHI